MLNNSGENGHSCLDPYFRGNAFRFSLLRIMFVVSLSYVAFFKLRQIPSMPIFWRVFYHKGVLNFVESFSCICWNYHMVFTFQFVNMVYHMDWLVYTEESLHPWDKPYLIMVYDHFNVLLNSVLFKWE